MADELFDNNKKINDLMLSKYPKNKDTDVSSIVRKAQKLQEISEQYKAQKGSPGG